MSSPIQAYLDRLYDEVLPLRDGAVANYIPELTRVDPDSFGICLVTMDGQVYAAGATDKPFTIQSISKPFIYATALSECGQEKVSAHVGVEPSGEAFNSISLHPQTGAPMNPMINAGAIASTSLVRASTPEQQWQRIAASLGRFIGRDIGIDEAVYRSESETGARNRAIAWMLKNFGIIEGEPMAPLENYFRQCSVLVSCRDLAFMAATLGNRGLHPLTGERALASMHVPPVLSVMATCGMYDYAGSWLYEVGMPAKSGVGGGIIAVQPGRFGIGIYSPRLDAKGNSVRGIEVCKRLARDLDLNIFNQVNSSRAALTRVYTGADAPSRREPGPVLRACLLEHAHRIKYLTLHGHLGVDAMEYVLRTMDAMRSETHSFILDMHQVKGLSPSAARFLNEARLDLKRDGIAVVLSRVSVQYGIRERLRKSYPPGDYGFLCFEDNDLAVEWCENRLSDEMPVERVAASLADFALFQGVPVTLIRLAEQSVQHATFEQGDCVLNNGEDGDDRIFFIESGKVSILVPRIDGGHQRVSTLGPGSNFGELILLGQTKRSASVYADTDVKCHVLTASELNRISSSEPTLRIRLLENLANDLANKLRPTTQLVSALA
jgi:glutaminase